MAATLDPRRTIRDLEELRALTGDADGAQRVAFTPTWLAARAWFRERLAGLPVEVHADAAGNVWTTLPGASDRAVVIGSHIDSVPNGGWLDGCLGLLAGLEVLRRVAADYAGTPPVTLRVVDWADEEGARFGKSLFGSAACSGNLDLDEARRLGAAAGNAETIKRAVAMQSATFDFDEIEAELESLGRVPLRALDPERATQMAKAAEALAARAAADGRRADAVDAQMLAVRSWQRAGNLDAARAAAAQHDAMTGGKDRQ